MGTETIEKSPMTTSSNGNDTKGRSIFAETRRRTTRKAEVWTCSVRAYLLAPSHNTSDPTIAASETIASGCDPEVTTPLSDTTDDDETVQGTAACMPDDVVAAVPAAGSLGLLGGLLGL